MEEGAKGDWPAIEDVYVGIVARIPRNPSIATIESLLEEFQMLHEEIVNQLNTQEESENNSTNAALNERHIQNSNTNSLNELEPSFGEKQGEKLEKRPKPFGEPTKAFPLAVVLKACPTIVDYAIGGAVVGWRDLMQAAVVVRSTLGVSPSAYQDACAAMGPENAAIAIACILERAEFIKSPGGYLRDLTRRAELGEFSLGPMVMAALRANYGEGLKAG